MPLRSPYRHEDDPTPSLTPMIDVVLVLTIFFMCATRFSGDERQFEVELPSVSAAAPVTAVRPELLEITATGEVQLGGELVTRDELTARLAMLCNDRPDLTVLVRGDRAVSHGQMAEIYEACRLAGIRHVGISVASKAAGTVVR